MWGLTMSIFKRIAKKRYFFMILSLNQLIYNSLMGVDNTIDKNIKENQLICAIKNKDKEQVKTILDSGANINFKDKVTNYTPIFHALNQESIEIAELLLKNGAELDSLDKLKLSPLMVAVMQKRYKVIRFLLDNWADMSIKSTKWLNFANYFHSITADQDIVNTINQEPDRRDKQIKLINIRKKLSKTVKFEEKIEDIICDYIDTEDSYVKDIRTTKNSITDTVLCPEEIAEIILEYCGLILKI